MMIVLGDLAERAAAQLGEKVNVSIIAKEILQYDMLAAMREGGFLDSIVFHGGTALRLCHGAPRFSEDLDFTGGNGFEPAGFAALGSVIHRAVSARFAGDIGIKHAKGLAFPGPRNEHCVSTWRLRVPTFPRRRHLPHQRVKIDIVNVDAFTAETMPVRVNHDCIPEELRNISLRVSTREEILANKLVSLPEAWAASQTNVRYRDIWDIGWLAERNTPLNLEWVAAKRVDRGAPGGIEAVLRMRDKVQEFATSADFASRMAQQLTGDLYTSTIAQPGFTEQLGTVCAAMLNQVAEFDTPDTSAAPSPF